MYNNKLFPRLYDIPTTNRINYFYLLFFIIFAYSLFVYITTAMNMKFLSLPLSLVSSSNSHPRMRKPYAHLRQSKFCTSRVWEPLLIQTLFLFYFHYIKIDKKINAIISKRKEGDGRRRAGEENERVQGIHAYIYTYICMGLFSWGV